MKKLLEEIFTIIFLPGYERIGPEFLLKNIKQYHSFKYGKYFFVKSDDLKLLDDAGIAYEIAGDSKI